MQRAHFQNDYQLCSNLRAFHASGRSSPKPPGKVWQASEPPFKGYQSAPTEGYQHSSSSTAIVIDNGTIILFITLQEAY